MSVESARHLRLLIESVAAVARPMTGTSTRAATPSLDRLIARAEREPFPEPELEPITPGRTQRLAREFHVTLPAGADFPVGAVTRLADGGAADDGYWLRADPVHLIPHARGMQMIGSEHLDLTSEEVLALATELRPLLAERQCVLEVRAPTRWTLRAPRDLDATATPLDDYGMVAGIALPCGPDGGWLRAIINDTQLALHASPVNAGRSARGVPPVNSLWLWGGGRLPEAGAAPLSALWADDPVATGLAIAAGITHHAAPPNAARWLADLTQAASGHHLLVLAMHGSADAEQYDPEQTMQSLENFWIAPLLAALGARAIASVTLVSPDAPALTLTRNNMWRFWRRRTLRPVYPAASQLGL